MTDYVMTGIVLGLSAGLTPGPLLTLVITETLRHGIASGVRVAFSPLLTDLPIILLTLLIFSQVTDFHTLLGIISLVGGGVILYMGYETIHPQHVDAGASHVEARSLLKGVLVNVLSPHPYLFWLSVGGALMSKALNQSVGSLVCFIGSFYCSLIGAKIALAILVGRSRHFLSSTMYTYTLRLLGAALCLLALFLFHEGLVLLGIVGA
ncbi:LysE family translocator [Pseudodesulfovibrio sediminis]|uniref:LysE family translocator n=1 Tax=Pseudodesulfovibrio sediminis TaxID=2810563 RepID=A0ABM7P9F7_9BACT|nr:LysE family transporter [Pseudodesulfovibrio sediminis]BCS89698.1 LysE family translocator [Pseudodesulfovibrio sediminis]